MFTKQIHEFSDSIIRRLVRLVWGPQYQIMLSHLVEPFQRVQRQTLSQKDWVNNVGLTTEESQHPTTAALMYHSDDHPTLPRLPAQATSLTTIGFMSLSLFIFIILVLCVIASIFTHNSIPFFRTSTTLERKKRRKDRPGHLDLSVDLEAQNRQRHHHVFSGSHSICASSTGSSSFTTRSTVTSAIEMDELTSEMVLRGVGSSGEVQGGEEESPLGLSRYFFDDGIGIKGYESWDGERAGKED